MAEVINITESEFWMRVSMYVAVLYTLIRQTIQVLIVDRVIESYMLTYINNQYPFILPPKNMSHLG